MERTVHIIFFVIAVVLFVGIVWMHPVQDTRSLQSNAKKIHPSPSPAALIAQTDTHDMDNTFVVSIKAQNIQVPLRTAQIELGYDPLLLQADQLMQGDLFVAPEYSLQILNNNSGRISLGITCSKKNNCTYPKKETIIKILFKQTAYTPNNTTELKILPKTILLDQNNKEIDSIKKQTLIKLQKLKMKDATSSAL